MSSHLNTLLLFFCIQASIQTYTIKCFISFTGQVSLPDGQKWVLFCVGFFFSPPQLKIKLQTIFLLELQSPKQGLAAIFCVI